MEKVYSDESLMITHHVKNLLENQGINCILKNEAMQSVVGEVPPIVAWPEVWIVKQENKTEAELIVNDFIQSQKEQSNQPQWQCDKCNETNDGNFAICWNCNSIQ